MFTFNYFARDAFCGNYDKKVNHQILTENYGNTWVEPEDQADK